jgi:tetratricopeptide (TPR) repeat protein
MIDPRMLDQIAPAPQQFEIPMQQGPIEPVPEAPPVIDRDTPLLNEFEALPRGDKVSSLADKINSLRFQSLGDTAFRKEDYAAAEESYRDAIERAPDRRSPWIRMVLLQIAIRNFPAAAQHLKTALSITDDRTRAWVSADELYGQRTAERARTHGSQLWNWLAERPLSADRLLLAGTFQKFRGYDAAAEELFELAHFEGPEAEYVARIRSIAEEDPGQRAISQELAQLKELATTLQAVDSNSVDGSKGQKMAPTKSVAADDSDGIFLRGSKDNAEEPVESSEELPQLIIPRQ